MDNTFIILVLIVIIVIVIIGSTIMIAISGNSEVGQRLRLQLIRRLRQLPFFRMLVKRKIDVVKYVHDNPLPDIENQLQKCEDCNVKNQCEDTLAKEGNTDYTFCPNNDYIESKKNAGQAR